MQYASFSEYRFQRPIADALAGLGFTSPTPIQRLAIAPQRAGHDLLGIACTGSGKTAAFGLPILDALLSVPRPVPPRGCHALVLAPTRELAGQIVTSLRSLAGRSRLRICAVIGGAPRRRQVAILTGGADVVVATPGRLLDLMRARAIRLHATRHLVIDEADRMLDLGFLEPVRQIASELAPDRQTVLFSATMPGPVEALAEQILSDPVRIDAPKPVEAERRIAARAEIVPPALKRRRLMQLVAAPSVMRAIVFCRTRRGADALGAALAEAGLSTGVMHGDKTQDDRSRTLGGFRKGRIRLLVATDLVARGIDVPGVSHVINFDLPEDPESYIHRIGRTGRAGASGEAITLCAPAELRRLRAIEGATGQALLPAMCRICHAAVMSRRPPALWPQGGGCTEKGACGG